MSNQYIFEFVPINDDEYQLQITDKGGVHKEEGCIVHKDYILSWMNLLNKVIYDMK